MKFELIIDADAPESVTAVVHARSPLTEELEALVLAYGGDRLVGYREGETKLLRIGEANCFFTEGGKTYIAATDGRSYLPKRRLCEVEEQLPEGFVRLNRGAIGQLLRIERFVSTFAGGIDAVFYGGHREYVSRRCLAELKRRMGL